MLQNYSRSRRVTKVDTKPHKLGLREGGERMDKQMVFLAYLILGGGGRTRVADQFLESSFHNKLFSVNNYDMKLIK